MFVCTFTITEYGTSGNELPPPPERSHVRSVLSSNESEKSFRDRMQGEGMAIRSYLNHQFEMDPKPYSRASACSWMISPVGSITDIVKGMASPVPNGHQP